MSKPLRLVFAGTPDFAVPSLQALHQSTHEVVMVYTQPDRPAGRGRKLMASPVKQYALAQQLPIHQCESLRDEESVNFLKSLEADMMIVAAYGLILPQTILNTPRLGCLNVHASLLPRWRGAAPIQRAILAGDSVTGISIMQMVAKLDAGDVFHKSALNIGKNETGGQLHDRLANLGAEALMTTLESFVTTPVSATPQDPSQVTYAEKLTKIEAQIDWQQPADFLARLIRAFNPWPMAYCQFQNQTCRIWQAEALNEQIAAEPGTLLSYTKAGIDVATGKGVLRLLSIQLPGHRPITASDFINSHPNLTVGDRFFH